MIGWENNQGAYFIDKLQGQIDDLVTEDTTLQTEIGTLSNLTTTAKTNLVSAVNEVGADVSTLSSAVSGMAPSSRTLSVTEGVTSVTINRSQCYIENDMCYVTGTITLSAEVATNTNIIDLPVATPSTTDFPLFTTNSVAWGTAIGSNIRTNGKLSAGSYGFNFMFKVYHES